jgi:hypothetical protein
MSPACREGGTPAQYQLSDGDLEVRERLKKQVSTLAERIGERNVKHYESLKATLEYIENSLKAEGFQVAEQKHQSN